MDRGEGVMASSITIMAILGGLTGVLFAILADFGAVLVAAAYPIGGFLAVSALIAASLLARFRTDR
mgnify:CR=1 FL=1